MDKARFEELKKKRFEEGLSDEEAGELGRFFAEEGGEQYQSTESFRQEQEADVAAELEKDLHPEGAEDRPETAKEEAESRPGPEEDQPAGTREPLWAREEETEEK